MRGRSLPVDLSIHPSPRRGGTRAVRRISIVVVLALVLGVAAPPSAVPPDHGRTPVSWLWSWLSARPSWAFADPPTPKQQLGRPVDGHYVKAARVADSGKPAKRAKGELGRYQPYRAAAGTRTSAAVPTGFDLRTSNRIGSAATAYSDVFQNADGSYTRRVHRQPINHQAPDGTWHPIVNRLKLDVDGRPQVTANSFGLSFAGGTQQPTAPDAAAPPGRRAGSDDLVRMTVEPGVELAYSLAGAAIGRPVVDREVARYPRIFPNVDLELGAQATGAKELLILRSADVPTEYVYPLRLKGLTPRIAPDGTAEFVNAKGEVAVTMPVGYLEDAAVDKSGAGAISHAVRYEIVSAGGTAALKMSVDGAWLRDRARRFPVVLDPTATLRTSGDTYVLSTDNVDHSTEDNMSVGTWNAGGQKSRALLRFDSFGSTFAGKKMSAAAINLFMSYQGNGTSCVARPYTVHTINAAWSVTGVRWANQPPMSASIGSASPVSTPACNNDEKIRNVGTWSHAPLNVAAVNAWVTGGANNGLGLMASESDSLAWKRFTSANPNLVCNHATYGGIQCDPFLDVTYTDNVAPQLNTRYPSNNTAVNTLTPELAARGSDPDNWPAKGLRYNFLIYNDQGAQLTTSGWVAGGVWRVPPGVLAWGKTYLYAVQVNDYSSTGPAAPVVYAFATQVPQPMITSSLAENGGKGYEPSVGNYTTSDVDAQVATAGPALSVNRDYNSLDTRSASAFGRGWSSILDMHVREGRDPGGALLTATVRYPNGQEVTFGRNNDGVWVPPSGRFSVFKPITGGYSLTDKDATAYEFAQAAGAGGFGITKITDASGRAVTFRYDAAGRIDQLRSASSNRTLAVSWSTPPGATHPHVATVETDPVLAGDPSTALTWTYSYDSDLLARVCPPGTSTACSTYDYDFVSQHASTVLNTSPYSFWRMNEPDGATTAQSAVLSNDGTDNGTYSNVTLGGPGPLPNSTSTSAAFNGTSSLVTLPIKPATGSSYQSVSMWFKTGTPLGVLFSYQRDAVTPGATTPTSYTPAIYIDSAGKLRAELWMGSPGAAMTSPGPVTDNQWHHVALAGNGGSQQLYLDGQQVASLAGTISLHAVDMPRSYVGAGFLGGDWPGHSHPTPTATYFNGSIADVAFYNQALTGTAVSAMYGSGVSSAAALTRTTSDAGRVLAQVAYDTVSGRVRQVTDENGGAWQIGTPTASGSSQVYVSAVLGSQPRDYFRLGDIEAPAEAVNKVIGNKASYSNVGFDTTQPNTTSPFADTYGAVFNGTSSNLRMDGFGVVPFEGPHAIEMWFKVPANHAQSGVLYSYQDGPVTGPVSGTTSWVPTLYVGADGYLRGGMWTGSISPITSSTKVNDGNWHHVVLSASYDQQKQTLYLDNNVVGTKAGSMVPTFAEIGYVGAGKTTAWPGSSRDISYFKGNIAEFAYYDKELSAAHVDSHFKASKSSLPPPAGVAGPVLTPISTATVTDPTGKSSKQMFDLVNGNRLIAQTDVLGNTTSYGFDVGGFVSVVYDPLGQKTESGKDVRGNTIRSTTCSHQPAEVGDECQTVYYRYWPDATTTNLTPDARNDQLTDIRDARSSGDNDERYRTRFAYDTSGNRVSMTTPPVPGFPAGRTTTLTYTTATTPAVGGGTTPPGLPLTTRSAGGSQQTTGYNAAGDAVRVTDPAGLITEFTYDGVGRVTSKKVISAAYPAGQVTTYGYDTDGQLIEKVEPPVTNRVTGAVHTAKTTDTFDADGNLTSRTVTDTTGGDSPRAAASDYNDRGQPVKTVDPTGAVTVFEFDLYGNQTKSVSCDSNPAPQTPCPADDVLRVIDNTYDAEGQLLTSILTGRDGTTTRLTSNAYYADGALASETDAMNFTTRYEYYNDGNVRRVSRTDGVKTFVAEENFYDKAGNLWSRSENNGATRTQFVFDAASRMQSATVSVNDVDRITNHVYDADDRVVAIRNSVRDVNTDVRNVLQTTENTYDAMGRVTSESISTNSASRPVGWWKLDETSTPGDAITAYDSSPSHHDASGYEGVSLGGGFGTFTTDMLSAEPVLDTTASYSVSAWVRVNNFNDFQTAVGQGGANHGAFFLQYHKSSNKWAFISPSSDSATPSTYYQATSSNALVPNTWVHLVGVFDADTKAMRLYVNNTAGTPATNPTPFRSDPFTGLTIGGIRYGNGNTHLFRGSLDNVQVYQRALSTAEVSTLYGGGNGRTADTTVSANQLTTNYTVDNRGLATAMVDPNGNTTNYEYDEAGRLVQTVAPSVLAESYGAPAVSIRPVSRRGYNAFGDQVETQDPLGNVTQVRVDAGGRPVKTIMPDYTPPGGAPIVGANATTVYDKLSQVTSTTDPRGKSTTYEYDPLGNVVKVTGPTGKVATAVYDKVGDLLETVDPTGARTTATYDFLGRKLTASQVVRQPSPVTNTTTYDYGTGVFGDTAEAGPWLRKVTSPDGVTATMTYNVVGEQVTVRDGVNNTKTMDYDGLGRVVKTTMPDNTRQTIAFDGAGRVIRTENRDAANAVLTTQRAAYDNNGNVIASTDPRNTTTTFTYDALGNVTGEVQPVTATTSINTSFGYDAAGNQTRFSDGRGNPFWTTYNTWSLPESQIEPATAAYPDAADRTFSVSYDEAGRPATQFAPGGVRIDNSYDDLNRLTGQTGSGAEAATAARTFDYDDAGRLTGMSVPDGTNTLSYDDRGLPLTITGPNDTASFTYTKDGRMASRDDAAGTTTYTYDVAGRFKTAANPTTGIGLTVGYNVMSQPATITYGTGNSVRTFTYDPLHRLKTDTLKTSNGATTLGSITYGYDANSNETSKVTTGFAGAASNTYTYDLADRLTSWTAGATTTDYAYDDSGNRTQVGSKTFSYDARNQLTSQSGGITYAYTARGTLRRTTANSINYATSADAYGQVISQEAAGGTSTYTYDATGRVVRPGFKYSGRGNTLAQDDNATYTRGPGGELLAEGTGTGTGSVYAWTDQHTDVVGQFSATGTALSGSATYDPLGKVIAAAGMVGNLGYQSEWTDGLTGRVNMLARWYNTDTGQFDTRDTASNAPVPDSVRANRFQYGDANPLTTMDPTGHWGWSSFKNAVSNVVKVVTNPVATFNAVTSYTSSAFNYVYSGRAWNDVKAKAKSVANKAKKAWNVVKDTTVRWAKKKINAVKDAYKSAKKCLSGGVGKCVKETTKKAVKKAVDTVKSTVEAIKKDPWKFVATAVVGLAAAVAVGALCATGVGCLLVAGAVAGAMSAGAGFMVDVARGDQKFSWSGLAGSMIEGGLDGALSAGLSKFTGGATRLAGGAAKGAAGAAAARLPGLGARASGPAGRPAVGGGGSPAHRPAAGSPGRSGGGGGQSAPSGGRHRADDQPTKCAEHSFDPATRVLMANGSTKPIKDIAPGDRVAAKDPVTGTAAGKVVSRLHINADRDLTDVTVRDAKTGKSTVLKTTQHHPFWDATDRRWVDAAKLTPGHRLLSHDDKRLEGDGTGAGAGGGGPGSRITVVKVVNFHGNKTMRDLTVADIHTYYVIAGNTPVLVHNCGSSVRQMIGAIRNKANDTYLGRLLMGRPMEPWRSNRALHRQLGGSAPDANATVRDLLDLMPGNPANSYKVASASGRDDAELLASVFTPRDGQYIAVYEGRPGVIGQGNHRAMELIARAEDPNSSIEWDERIFIHHVGE